MEFMQPLTLQPPPDGLALRTEEPFHSLEIHEKTYFLYRYSSMSSVKGVQTTLSVVMCQMSVNRLAVLCMKTDLQYGSYTFDSCSLHL